MHENKDGSRNPVLEEEKDPIKQKRRVVNGRTGGDRTRDPNIKSVVLYQLSYSP